MSCEKSLSTLRFPARADQLKIVRRNVISTLQDIACAENEIDRLVLAVNEACMNVIQHGYGENGCGDNGSGEIILEILVDSDEAVFRITDYAATVDPAKIKSRDLDDIRPGGLGVHFINEVMDKVEFIKPSAGTGNILELRKRIL